MKDIGKAWSTLVLLKIKDVLRVELTEDDVEINNIAKDRLEVCLSLCQAENFCPECGCPLMAKVMVPVGSSNSCPLKLWKV